MTLMMGGVNGILGNDLFSKYDVCINHGQQVAIRQLSGGTLKTR
jgi:hypothetical protein